MKIAIVSNCQAEALARFVPILSDRVEAAWIDVHRLDEENGAGERSKLLSEADLIFTAPIVAEHLPEDVRTGYLEDSFPGKVHKIPNCYFAGFHPDMTYLGGMFDRLEGAAGGLHSTIAIDGYLSGLSPTRAALNFTDPVYYRRKGLFQKFSDSIAEMMERDEGLAIKLYPKFNRMLYEKLAFYTINHPTRHLLAEIAKDIIRLCGLRPMNINSFQLPDPLWDSIVWPISPCVADEHKLPFGFGDVIATGHPHHRFISFEDFCAASYATFAQNRDAFEASSQVRAYLNARVSSPA
jgi:Polysaccharide biosynthesis enzyme WcbI